MAPTRDNSICERSIRKIGRAGHRARRTKNGGFVAGARSFDVGCFSSFQVTELGRTFGDLLCRWCTDTMMAEGLPKSLRRCCVSAMAGKPSISCRCRGNFPLDELQAVRGLRVTISSTWCRAAGKRRQAHNRGVFYAAVRQDGGWGKKKRVARPACHCRLSPHSSTQITSFGAENRDALRGPRINR